MLLQPTTLFRPLKDVLGVSIPQAVSAVATQGGHLLCLNNLVSIPQAVSAVATNQQLYMQHRGVVSIPQAVSAVATVRFPIRFGTIKCCFNTASGKCCCNENGNLLINVSAMGFNTASGKCCCNSGVWEASIYVVPKASFGKSQTVNGKFSLH